MGNEVRPRRGWEARKSEKTCMSHKVKEKWVIMWDRGEAMKTQSGKGNVANRWQQIGEVFKCQKSI